MSKVAQGAINFKLSQILLVLFQIRKLKTAHKVQPLKDKATEKETRLVWTMQNNPFCKKDSRPVFLRTCQFISSVLQLCPSPIQSTE